MGLTTTCKQVTQAYFYLSARPIKQLPSELRGSEASQSSRTTLYYLSPLYGTLPVRPFAVRNRSMNSATADSVNLIPFTQLRSGGFLSLEKDQAPLHGKSMSGW